MNKNIQVSVSILCADFTRLAEEVKKCEDAGVDRLHIDVMDGHFVPNITIGSLIVKALRPITKLPLDSHLMIENPSKYLNDFIQTGSDAIYIHAECYGPRRDACKAWDAYPKEVDTIDVEKAKKDILAIKKAGKKAYMVLNPGTPPCIESLLGDIDGILVMSVNPGFAKQKFMPQVLPKLQKLRDLFNGDIAIDGGINETTAPEAVKAGANLLATASYFFGAKNPKEVVRSLKDLKSL